MIVVLQFLCRTSGSRIAALAIAAALIVAQPLLPQIRPAVAADAEQPAIPASDEADDWNKRGFMQLLKDDLDGAAVSFTNAITIGERIGNSRAVAQATGNLGNVYNRRGDLARAEELHIRSLKLYEELGNKQGMIDEYSNLGHVYTRRGDLARAEEMFTKALNLSERLGNKITAAYSYDDLARLYIKSGDIAKACAHRRKARKLYAEFGSSNVLEQVDSLLREGKCPAE